jgi:diguanylate cyclase (GGDEF)-like protein
MRRAGLLRACWVLCLAGWLAGPAWAGHAGEPPRFDTVAVDKIPREVVAALAQDSQGLLWVATGDGLARFDGLRLQPQELTEARSPAERNLGWVRALLAGRDGRVWVGTETRGLAVWDPQDESLRLVEPSARLRPTLMALAEDRDGSIWAGGQDGGLARYDRSGRQAPQVWRASGRPGSLPDDRIKALLVDRDDTLWIGTWAGLVRRRGEVFETVLPELADQQVQALWQAHDGALWIGTGQGGLVRLDSAGRSLILPPSPAGAVTALAEPQPGQLWVARERGIELRDASDGSLQQWLRYRPLHPEGLASDAVKAVLTDAQGVVWVAGLGVGLQRHDPKPTAFRVFGAEPDPASPLANPSVQALLARRDGRIWAATDANEIAELDTHLAVVGRGPRLGQRADALLETADGHLWAGLPRAVQELDAAGRPLRRLTHGGGYTRRLFASGDQRLWVAAADGLWCLERGAAQLRRVMRIDGQSLGGEVNALAETPDGTLWVASSLGLWRVEPGGSALAPVASPPDEGLGNAVVIGLLVDRQGRLWLDTAVSGLHRLREWRDGLARFDRIGERHGVTGRPFGANLLEDAQGRIWSQMQVYDPRSDRLSLLGASDGVRIGMPWFFSYAKTADGRLLFGGTRGIVEVRPEAWSPEQLQPRLRIVGIHVDGRRQPVRPALQGLLLPPGTQRVLVDIGLLGVIDAGSLRYQYRIDGLDVDWQTSIPGQGQLSLLQLAPGDYRLRLRASPEAAELVLPLRMLPAWWQTGWAWLAAAVLLAATFAGLLGWRTRHLLGRQRELEMRVRERTRALEEASLTDPLTGLRNRRFLLERIVADCAAAERRHRTAMAQRAAPQEADLIFFLVDLDHFKRLNDAFGHAAGDAVLREMRERLAAVFRQGDHLVRWGGEEFLVVARDTSRAHAAELAERLRELVAARPFTGPEGERLVVTCSVGYACFPLCPQAPQAFDWQAHVAAADALLYAAKHAGRNAWRGLERADTTDLEGLRQTLAQPAERWLEAPGLLLRGSA